MFDVATPIIINVADTVVSSSAATHIQLVLLALQ